MRDSHVVTAWLVAVCCASPPLARAEPRSGTERFVRQAWLADYESLKRELELNYAHLAWFASPEGGVDLPALAASTRAELRRARDASEARAALVAFVAGIHDGHLRAFEQLSQPEIPDPPWPPSTGDGPTACASYGYQANSRLPFSLPFETLAGFTLNADGMAEAFRAGFLGVEGKRIGIVRIPRFRPADYPDLCVRVWAQLRAEKVDATRGAISERIHTAWLRTLAERLQRLRAQGATAMVVDVGSNSGGDDLGDWAVRLFTPAPVRSLPMWMSASEAALPYFEVQLKDLRAALGERGAATSPGADVLRRAITRFEGLSAEAKQPPCDMSWVWRERRPWSSQRCKRLLDAGFASGALDYLEPRALPEPAANAVYWASAADSFRGAWSGPVYVVIDSGTASAAELFAATLHDRGVAKTIGTRTAGSGCGFVDRDTPFVLSHAHLAVRIPNCARLRADGTDDVAGVTPDILMAPLAGESSRGLAARALAAIAADLQR